MAGAVAVPALLLAYGAFAMARYGNVAPPGDSARLGLIHAGVDPKERWRAANHPRILRTLKGQTVAAERAGAELSVWPEAAYPYRLSHGAKRVPRGSRSPLGDGVRGPLLIGLITVEPPVLIGRDESGKPQFERNRFNSATIVSPSGTVQPPYDKMQLLWFGETVPFGQYLPWLRRIFQRSGGLLPGRELRPLELAREGATDLRIGVLNCYEDTLPHLGRRIVRELAPNLLVNVTNDAWFIGTSEPDLHLRLAVMRSIELRRDLVRAVNLGVAGWIDARGVVRARYDSPEAGFLLVEPQLRSGQTPYARFGDAPLALLLSLFALGARRWRRAAARSSSTRSESISRS
jgi:apolipoprotein N-acyltransferase